LAVRATLLVAKHNYKTYRPAMSTESKVRLEQDGALGTLTLDSPPLTSSEAN